MTWCALCCGAVALWVSFGTLAFLDTHNRASYVGVLPSPFWLVALLIVAAAVGVAGRPSARAVAPLWLSAVLLLPWAPVRLPLAVFIWTGNVVWWTWTAIGVALFGPVLGRIARLVGRATAARPLREAALAGAISLLAFSWSAWVTAPQHPNGDEPHYLIITQSLLEDHDLQIENNHRQRDYRVYLGNPLNPDYRKRGTNGGVYSIHAPGLPALVAPVFALFGYPGVVAALVLFAACGSALAWLAAWHVTHDRAASWFGWAAVSFSIPYFLLTGSVFPDGPGAVLTLVAVLALVDARMREPRGLILVGLALAILPWLHTRFAILAACAAVTVAGRLVGESERGKRLVALLAPPLVSAVAWLVFFQVVYGTPNPSAPYGGQTDVAFGNIVRGGPGLLVDQQFGLLSTAPIYLCALAGLAVMCWRGPRRLAAELLLITVPYFLVVAFFALWWAGTSPPARFLTPLVLVLAIPIASWLSTATSRVTRACGACALLLSVLIATTVAGVERGAFVFTYRDGLSRVALWLSPVVDLTKALPSLFQSSPPAVVAQAVIWLLAVAVAIGVARALEQRPGAVVRLGLALQVAVMAAVSLVWRGNHVDAATPASAGPAVLNQYLAHRGQLLLAYRPFARLTVEELPTRIVLERTASSSPQREWSEMAHLPPGTYRVSGTVVGAPAGHVRVRTDSRMSPLAEWDLKEMDRAWSRELFVPVAVSGLQVVLDDDARQHVRDLVVRAVSVVPPGDRLPDDREAGHGAHFGSATIYALGGTAWMEYGGIWVGAGDGAAFAVRPDRPGVVHLYVRNGAAANDVTLVSGTWRQALALKPGEERAVDIPTDPRLPGALLQVLPARGFRPSDVDPKSTDDRLLGVWIATQ